MKHLIRGVLVLTPILFMALGLFGYVVHLFILDVSTAFNVSDSLWTYLMYGYIAWFSFAVWYLSRVEGNDGGLHK
jgi:hypothetical protein